MFEVLNHYEAGKLSPDQVEESLQFHLDALEGIGSKEDRKLNDLTYRLVVADMSEGEEQFVDGETVTLGFAQI